MTQEKENFVCKLSKSLYGLKQSPRYWNNSFDQFMNELGFAQTASDSCIYIEENQTIFCVVAVYVDDIIIGCESEKEINDIKSALTQRFEMRDLGPLKYFLGVNVIQNVEQGTVFINQATYIKSLLRKFEFTDAKPVKSPVDVPCKR